MEENIISCHWEEIHFEENKSSELRNAFLNNAAKLRNYIAMMPDTMFINEYKRINWLINALKEILKAMKENCHHETECFRLDFYIAHLDKDRMLFDYKLNSLHLNLDKSDVEVRQDRQIFDPIALNAEMDALIEAHSI